MKKMFLSSAIAASMSLASLVSAGTLTIDPGAPVFTPPEAFTNNTIQAQVISNPEGVTGDLVRISGTATIVPPQTNVVTVDISGTYSAAADDTVSVAYSFTADLNSANPVQYTISGTVDVPGTGTIPFDTSGTITNGLNQYSGTIAVPATFPVPLAGSYTGELKLDFTAPPAATGTLDLAIQQIDFQLAPTAATLPPSAQSLNISTRGDVGTGEDVLIGGFILTGTQDKEVIIRALGPSLGLSGVTGLLNDPVLTLYDSSGAVIATNDNWKDNSADDQAKIIAAGLDMYNNGTTTAPIQDSEAIIVQTLTPDPVGYTAIVTGAGDTTGIGLVEVYDEDTTTDGQLANISTRGLVGTVDDVLIGGFILGPDTDGSPSVVVRALGPSLADKGVTSPLLDPTLDIFDSNGDMINSNDNWGSGPDAATITADGLAPSDPNESALLLIPPPGEYTAIVSGVNDTTGVGLVEVYNLTQQPVTMK